MRNSTITAGGARTFLSASACEAPRGVDLRPVLPEADRNVGVFPCCPCAATRTRRQQSPMPLGFDPPHPGGMAENSPTFQRWGREFRGAQVPKGRLEPCAIRQPSLRDLLNHGRWFPTLKRWAIIGCPSGTKTWLGFAGVLWDQILRYLTLLSAAACKVPRGADLRQVIREAHCCGQECPRSACYP